MWWCGTYFVFPDPGSFRSPWGGQRLNSAKQERLELENERLGSGVLQLIKSRVGKLSVGFINLDAYPVPAKYLGRDQRGA
ncbi:hypothetical protein SAMN05421772_10387 [Paracoccus saliphilus]|uniref:Uncharacterized protein n=1 Tax=Paracoccus saliphilus TaxID=405559 RepID=A0AA46A4U6_9RHOB|nr:hypothetical protein SAMN05421772_10387 [Paracoccus saliphilus]